MSDHCIKQECCRVSSGPLTRLGGARSLHRPNFLLIETQDHDLSTNTVCSLTSRSNGALPSSSFPKLESYQASARIRAHTRSYAHRRAKIWRGASSSDAGEAAAVANRLLAMRLKFYPGDATRTDGRRALGSQRQDLHQCAGTHGTWRPARPCDTLGVSFVLAD
jgi:hypothetical protein